MKSAWSRLSATLTLAIVSASTSIALSPKSTNAATPHTLVVPTEIVKTHTIAQAPPSVSAKPAQTERPEITPPSKLVTILQRRQKLMEADRLYLAGQIPEAEKLYREVKAPFATTGQTPKRPEPILDPVQLSPAGRVYWREAQAGASQKLQPRIMVPLRLLVEEYPQFIPGHLRLAEVLQQGDRSQEAINVLEQATSLYPNQPELVKAKVAALAADKKWMEASLAARQFAVLNSGQQSSAEFIQLADENLNRYKKHLRRKLRGNTIANIITGALGYAVTGNLLGPISAVQTTAMVLKGESSIGKSVTKDARKQLPMVEDKVVVGYVNELGQKLAKVSGRNDFQYEFYVVLDDGLNAFALPGGKVFVNAGAIAHTKSEAELAGLIAHELSHAVLSHSFQLVAQGNLIANVTQYVPYGGTVASLFTLDYSRDMERQADTLGTRLIASSGYAADGLRNLMVTLQQQEKSSPPAWLSSHPGTDDRIRDLENLIERNGYNRYAYEGVARHAQIKAQVEKLLINKEQQRQKKHHR
jgi:predicted Zn-dependent protease